MKEYVYFVSFATQGGFGNNVVRLYYQITNVEQIRKLEEDLRAANRVGALVIISFQLLGVEEAVPVGQGG